jgi:mannose-6-phosphate isomerase-like protein (cupin superfamily)
MNKIKVFNEIQEWLEQHPVTLTEEELLELLKVRRRWPKKYLHTEDFGSIELISYFSTLTNVVHRNDLFDGGGYLDYRRFKEYYDRGFTFMLVDILDLTEDFRKINEYFVENYGTQVQGNLYVNGNSHTGCPSFDSHNHNYDVFTKQLWGKSDWTINGRDLSVKPGQSLVIPAETMHRVNHNSEKRCSLTINLQ